MLNQINKIKELVTFKIFNSEEYLRLEQIGPKETSQVRRITDSHQITKKLRKELKSGRGRPKNEAVKAATETNPDNTNDAAKQLTRSRGKALAS